MGRGRWGGYRPLKRDVITDCTKMSIYDANSFVSPLHQVNSFILSCLVPMLFNTHFEFDYWFSIDQFFTSDMIQHHLRGMVLPYPILFAISLDLEHSLGFPLFLVCFPPCIVSLHDVPAHPAIAFIIILISPYFTRHVWHFSKFSLT